MAKADVLTPSVQAALKELKFDATKAAAQKPAANENMPPPSTNPRAVSTSSSSGVTGGFMTPVKHTPKKSVSYAPSTTYTHSNQKDDEWDHRNDHRAMVEYDDERQHNAYDRDAASADSRYSLQARRAREQQQQQQAASKSSVLGFFSSVTSYFF